MSNIARGVTRRGVAVLKKGGHTLCALRLPRLLRDCFFLNTWTALWYPCGWVNYLREALGGLKVR